MLISLKCDYAIRALMELGNHKDSKPVQKKDIASARDIPGPFLDQILASLRRTGFIQSFRGPKGGHLLSKVPHKINLFDVITSLEGEVASLEPDENCCHKWVWNELDALISDKLSSIYLSDLLDREAKEKMHEIPNYSI